MSDRRWALEPMSPTRPMGPQSLRPMRSRKIRFQGCLPPSPGWFGMVIGSLTSRSNAGAVRSSHWSAATRCPVSDRPALGAAGIATVNRHGSHNPGPTAGRPGQVPPGHYAFKKGPRKTLSPVHRRRVPTRQVFPHHSHSIVPGGLLVRSSTTRLTPLTSLVMRVLMRSRSS